MGLGMLWAPTVPPFYSFSAPLGDAWLSCPGAGAKRRQFTLPSPVVAVVVPTAAATASTWDRVRIAIADSVGPVEGIATVCLFVALWLGWVRRLGRFGFYGAFALAVTASVQLVGIYLV